MIKRNLYILLLLVLGIGLMGCASAGPPQTEEAAASPAVVTDVSIVDGGVEVRLSSEQTPSFTVYKPSDPFTVVVDLPGAELGDVAQYIGSVKPGISEVRLAETAEPAQAVKIEVLLEMPGEMEADYSDGVLVLSLKEEESTEAAAMTEEGEEAEMTEEPELAEALAPDLGMTEEPELAEALAPDLEMTEEPELAEALAPDLEMTEEGEMGEETEMPGTMEEAEPEAPSEATSITAIEFDYANGKKRLVIRGNGALNPEVYTLDGKIVIDIPGVTFDATVPAKVVSPVTAIRQGMYEGAVRLIVDLKEKVAFVASAEDDALYVSFPLKEEEMAAMKGKPGMPARMPAKAAAMPGAPMAEMPGEAGVPEVEYVGKRISLDFQDADIKPIIRLLAGDVGGYNVVLHPQVTGTINLKLKDVPWDKALDIILKQNNLGRMTDENIMWVAPTAVFRQQEEEEAKRKQTYEKVAELKQEIIHLRHIGAADMSGHIIEAKVMSPRGQLRIDSRTNNLIINDTEENIKKIIAEEIPYWDTPEHGTMQVLIEAKIVEVSTNYSRALGIRWSTSHTRNSQGGADTISTTFGVNSPLSSVANPVLSSSIVEVGSVSTVSVNLSLEALESVGKTKKLANPKVLTIDKKPAIIKQGVQIPFTTIEDGTAKTEFEEAVLSLNVTPEIQPDGIIRLEVKANNDTPVQVGGETGINNQEIQTQALVKDTETLVLGGIYTNTESTQEERIPWLGRVPFLGWLFKTQIKTAEPKELLVFITPRIVR